MYTTSSGLLERLCQPQEQSAWERFGKLYTPLLFQWADRLDVHDPEAADLVQLARELTDERGTVPLIDSAY